MCGSRYMCKAEEIYVLEVVREIGRKIQSRNSATPTTQSQSHTPSNTTHVVTGSRRIGEGPIYCFPSIMYSFYCLEV